MLKKITCANRKIANADNSAATEARPTADVDCVIELSTYGSLQEVGKLLRNHKFVNDIESGVICRWKYKGETHVLNNRQNITSLFDNEK